MKLYADDLIGNKRNLDGEWVVAKPLDFWSLDRFIDIWDVFIGKAKAVYFHEEKKK